MVKQTDFLKDLQFDMKTVMKITSNIDFEVVRWNHTSCASRSEDEYKIFLNNKLTKREEKEWIKTALLLFINDWEENRNG